jgi:hypothetical protein
MTQRILLYQSPDLRQPTQARNYALLAMLCAASAIAYVQRSAIAMAAPFIRGDLRLDTIQFGLVMSAWSAGYAIGQIPSGSLADRWGSRRSLTLFALMWSVATGMLATARGYHSLLMLWTLMGLAQAGLFPQPGLHSRATRIGHRPAGKLHGHRRSAGACPDRRAVGRNIVAAGIHFLCAAGNCLGHSVLSVDSR